MIAAELSAKTISQRPQDPGSGVTDTIKKYPDPHPLLQRLPEQQNLQSNTDDASRETVERQRNGIGHDDSPWTNAEAPDDCEAKQNTPPRKSRVSKANYDLTRKGARLRK